ncbi:MAG: hypothetical protein ACKOW4_00515, partial [Aquirufa sp.]
MLKRLRDSLMKKTLFALLFAPLLSLAQMPVSGLWRASIATHGGELPIHLEINPGSKAGYLAIQVINGAEKSSLGESYFRGDSLVIPFDLYDSEFLFRVTKNNEMKGYFVKKRNEKTVYRLPVTAISGAADRFVGLQPATVNISGKWMADFFSDATNHSPGVGIFEQKGNQVTGTFLRTS